MCILVRQLLVSESKLFHYFMVLSSKCKYFLDQVVNLFFCPISVLFSPEGKKYACI